MNERITGSDGSSPHAKRLTRGRRLRLSGAVSLVILGAMAAPPRVAAQVMKPSTAERVKRATVLVFTAASKTQKGDQPLGSGSGYFINRTGLLVTNNHVVDPAHKKSLQEKQEFHYQTGRLTWTVVTNSGTAEEKTWEADVIYQNDAADQAILQAHDESGGKLPTANYLLFLPETRLQERMKVWAMGFPGGDSQRTSRDKHPEASISDGFVTALPRTPAGRVRMIMTDLLARPGNSGGPVVDVDGFCVGTATLMGQSEGRANTSALVPAALSTEFVGNAFNLGRIPKGTDVTPFLDILADSTGQVRIPEYERLADRDVLFFPNGDRIYGTVSTDKIKWKSSLGALEVPIEAIAYVMSDQEGADLVLEGGDHIRSSGLDAKFQFAPEGGTPTEQRFNEVGVVGFRTGGRQPEPVSGDVLVFNSDTGQLALREVDGKAKFDSRAGAIDMALEDITRIDTSDDDQQVVSLNDGRRFTGRFQATPITAKFAATKTPITFALKEVTQATIELRHIKTGGVGGLDLMGVLASADRRVQRVAQTLIDGDVEGARPKLDQLLDREEFRKLSTATKEQVRLLEGVLALRGGDFDAADKAFRRAAKGEDANVASYANAGAAVLKRFGREYDGRPLSDYGVFVQGGTALARELVQSARELLKERQTAEGKKGEYGRFIGGIRKEEESLLVAAVFIGSEAEDDRIQLWKFATEVAARELRRIDELTGTGPTVEGRSERPGRGGRTPSTSRMTDAKPIAQWEREKLEEDRADVLKVFEDYQTRLNTYGFRIEDPDIREFQDRQEKEP